MTHSTLDAAGRILRLGDTVGGTATEPHGSTIIGTLTAIDGNELTVLAAEPWTLPATRTFLIGRPLVGILREESMHLALSGPAVFYVTPEENETRTITWVDYSAPLDERERKVCHALIVHALNVLDQQQQPLHGRDDGPGLIYAASDRATLFRVDEGTVDDPREWGICRALLMHALQLASRPVPVHLDEQGRLRP